jgi:hypothetical protein
VNRKPIILLLCARRVCLVLVWYGVM